MNSIRITFIHARHTHTYTHHNRSSNSSCSNLCTEMHSLLLKKMLCVKMLRWYGPAAGRRSTANHPIDKCKMKSKCRWWDSRRQEVHHRPHIHVVCCSLESWACSNGGEGGAKWWKLMSCFPSHSSPYYVFTPWRWRWSCFSFLSFFPFNFNPSLMLKYIWQEIKWKNQRSTENDYVCIRETVLKTSAIPWDNLTPFADKWTIKNLKPEHERVIDFVSLPQYSIWWSFRGDLNPFDRHRLASYCYRLMKAVLFLEFVE